MRLLYTVRGTPFPIHLSFLHLVRQLHPLILHLTPLVLVRLRLGDVETQALGIQVHLVLRVLQDLRNVLGVLELPQVDVGAGLLDGVTDELGGTCLTLGADDGGLLLLAGLVDDESSALGFLLSDLLGFDGGGELGGESKVLRGSVR